ncbi:MAG: DUF4242 domain-containing protein [Gemmatirosa sp.]|nr:DUF4242 domain-containing protein [Gemmatirosa sp.]
MPRYVVERTFATGFTIPLTADGDAACRLVDARNAGHAVHWLHSYVSEDNTRTYCVYDGPSPDAVQRAAGDSGLPIDRITEVRVFDPFFYRP